jgi:hypothetical protein
MDERSLDERERMRSINRYRRSVRSQVAEGLEAQPVVGLVELNLRRVGEVERVVKDGGLQGRFFRRDTSSPPMLLAHRTEEVPPQREKTRPPRGRVPHFF